MTSHRQARLSQASRVFGRSNPRLQKQRDAWRRQKLKFKGRDKVAPRRRELVKLDGNKEDGVGLLDSSAVLSESAFDVAKRFDNQQDGYRLSLPFDASDEEIQAFYTYIENCQSHGWSLMPVEASKSEKIACVVSFSKDKAMDDVTRAATIVDGILRRAFRGAHGDSRR